MHTECRSQGNNFSVWAIFSPLMQIKVDCPIVVLTMTMMIVMKITVLMMIMSVLAIFTNFETMYNSTTEKTDS